MACPTILIFNLIYHFKSGENCVSNSLLACLDELKTWMARNLGQLNQGKTEMVIFGPVRGCSDIVTYLGPWLAY